MYVCTYALSVLFVYQLSCISECVFGLFFLQRDHSETKCDANGTGVEGAEGV